MSEIAVSESLENWLAEALPGRGPFRLQPLSGGNSNETLLLSDEEGGFVLRRPPADAIDASAHSMEREYRILKALENVDVPSPLPVGVSPDDSIDGSPFFVMEAVEGFPLTDELPDGIDPARAAAGIGSALMEGLAKLHKVDWRACGLSDFGRPEGFLDRQVPRWSKQYNRIKVRDLPRFDQVGEWLAANLPPEQEPAIMHGDFHLDNTLIAFEPDVHVTAIIDWEMSTIGDPLFDLGISLAFWGPDRPEVMAMPQVQGVSRLPGSPSREELAAHYAEHSGRSVENLNWYMTMAFWKLAAIVEGAYAQHVAGLLDTGYAARLERDVPAMLEEAAGFAGLD
jgi:aminoglycoside phosphotransferase (APT) family kinase protein